MELFKYRNHRDIKYLDWLRGQNCIISNTKAECAHHVRLGTNGGSALKPSDYFCIPLLHSYHTTGTQALHIIGEKTFFETFNLVPIDLYIYYLGKYQKEVFNTHIKLEAPFNKKNLLKLLIKFMEENGPQQTLMSSKSKKKKKSLTEDLYYQEAKEMRRVKDKELRAKLKLKAKKGLKKDKTSSEIEFAKKAKLVQAQFRKEQYKKAKELKAQNKVI